MKFKASHPHKLRERISAALGEVPVDILIKDVELLDVFGGGFHRGNIAILDDMIVGTFENYEAKEIINGEGLFAVPGFIDSHVHIESSLLTPARFQETVLPAGTTTALWDPHEITNVLGKEGIDWALRSLNGLLLDVFVLIPSCVPASHLETSGAMLSARDLQAFQNHPLVLGLAEFMNYPGVLSKDDEVIEKLTVFNSQIRDGHAPGLSGKKLNAYLCAGIQSCHESTTIEEAREKLIKGMHVLIREGSCAKDADVLLPLISSYSSATVALCSDDRNPLDIREEGHLDHIIRMGLKKGLNPEDLFRSASFAAARAYGLFDRGVIAPGYLADVCLLKKRSASWKDGFDITQVIKKGRHVNKKDLGKFSEETSPHSRPKTKGKNINIGNFATEKLKLTAPPQAMANVIGVIPGQIVTEHLKESVPAGEFFPDVSRDLLKIAVIERHHKTGNVGVGIVKGFQLKEGALAASIAHDSHNIVVIAVSDDALNAAVKAIEQLDGGIVVVDGQGKTLAQLALPIGGLMTDKSPQAVADSVVGLKNAAKSLGCTLHEPFLQMSFLALPVIPDLKITDKGLVNVQNFVHISAFFQPQKS